MELYNERMCLWCWDIEKKPVRALWTIICESNLDGPRSSENLCDKCKEQAIQMSADAEVDPDMDGWHVVETKPYIENSPAIFVRGDRVEIARVNRPRLTGTVVHCYMSLRTFTPTVNVVVDGKKWPTVFPTHIVQHRKVPNAAAN
jgi:hypothetical protein